MSSFPILFTLDGSSRHEIIMVSPSASYDDLSQQIGGIITTSPNCEEFMSKFKKIPEDGEKIKDITVRWSSPGRDAKIFPASTIVTDNNCEAVLSMIERAGVGKDVLEVRLAIPE